MRGSRLRVRKFRNPGPHNGRWFVARRWEDGSISGVGSFSTWQEAMEFVGHYIGQARRVA